jgi:23S rRNA U2552 (ribose-2'-O)-methylase RlmE/FtsJ
MVAHCLDEFDSKSRSSGYRSRSNRKAML